MPPTLTSPTSRHALEGQTPFERTVAPTARSGAGPRRLGPALAALALGGFAIGTSEFVAMGLLPEVARGVGVSVPTAGHVISAYALGVLVGAPLLATLGARYARRTLLVALMAAFTAGNLFSVLAPDYEVLVLSRFVAGLPHGAYFGVASLVAADIAGPGRRASAVARVLLGLSVANVVGVPAATWLGQGLGWRAAFATVALLAALAAIAVIRTVPSVAPDRRATLRRELQALRRGQVWLALAVGAVGGGGMFAVYSYVAPILTGRSGLAASAVPIALAAWGLGMVAGSLIGGRLMDWRPVAATFLIFAAMTLFFALFVVASAHAVTAVASIFLLGTGLALPTALQVRLMDVAGEAQTLAAALNHSSFNAANALGAWIGGVVLAAGLGFTAPIWAAVGLSLAGMAIFACATRLERRMS